MTQIAPHAAVPPPGAAPTAAANGAETAPARPRRERDPFFDNAKFMAILLVVVGHCLALLRNHVPLAGAAYLTIYMFHMPLFIVITGYFSRNFTFAGGKARKLITVLGVPYVVFEVAYSGYDWAIGGGKLDISPLDPYYLTWFLLALFLWRLSTPVWQQIRWPLGVAVGVSLLSYMTELSSDLDMHRVFGLLPFYVLGLCLRPEHFELVKHPIARVLGVVTLAGAFAIAWFVHPRMDWGWLYWKSANSAFAVDNVTGTLMRIGMLVCGTILLTAFLTLVPARRTWFTRLGATTLYAYLLHGFFTRLLKFTGWADFDWLQTWQGTIAISIVAIAVGTFLCSPPVVRCMRWALEPKMSWAFTPLRRPRSAQPTKKPSAPQ